MLMVLLVEWFYDDHDFIGRWCFAEGIAMARRDMPVCIIF
jgi:hypothetical protein